MKDNNEKEWEYKIIVWLKPKSICLWTEPITNVNEIFEDYAWSLPDSASIDGRTLGRRRGRGKDQIIQYFCNTCKDFKDKSEFDKRQYNHKRSMYCKKCDAKIKLEAELQMNKWREEFHLNR